MFFTDFLRKVRAGVGMKSLDVSYRKFSSRGVDGAVCDVLATALMVAGRDAQQWMGRPELAEYSFWVINRDDETAWSYGPNKGY